MQYSSLPPIKLQESTLKWLITHIHKCHKFLVIFLTLLIPHTDIKLTLKLLTCEEDEGKVALVLT